MTTLYCASCRRTNNGNPDGVDSVKYQGVEWCASCADIRKTADGLTYVLMPNLGRMYEAAEDDPLTAWEDCYEKIPKKRILVGKAKAEIQRTWDLWEEDKSSNISMFAFFGWLTRYRPYFLTFRGRGDPWQKVHSWLIQHEEKKKQGSKSET